MPAGTYWLIFALVGTATASEFFPERAEVADPSALTQLLPVLPLASIPPIDTGEEVMAVPNALCVAKLPTVVYTALLLPLAYTLPSITVCGIPRPESALWITVFRGAVAVPLAPVMHTVTWPPQYPLAFG